MKKTVITLILSLALILILPITAFAEKKDYVVDNGNLLSESEEETLEIKLKNLSEEYSFDIVALTVSSLDGKSAMEYADDYYDYNGYRSDGCILLISTDRDWWISTSGYGITAITDYGVDVIEQDVVHPYFGEDNWSGGFNRYADVVEDFVVSAKSGKPYDVDNYYTNDSGHTYKNSKFNFKNIGDDIDATSVLISVVVAGVIAAVIMGMVKSKYKPVRFSPNAADYLVDGSLNLTEEYDHFLFSNVTKTKIERESSGGSSTHTSSSGSSHGGGGGKF